VDSAIDAWKQGASDYICKPFKLDEVRLTLRRALERRRLVTENRVLKEALVEAHRPPPMVAQSRVMRDLLSLVATVAPSRSNVLVTGESGVGKELVARSIHALSPRAHLRFLPFHCAARAESLLESELFGYEKGAFTGAERAKPGVFEAVEGGTVFLDEIGEVTPGLQSKLLRTIQEREVLRLGSTAPRTVDFRLVAATNRELAAEIQAGRFREDLYYRLNVIALEVPPLRRRSEDVLPLARLFLERFAAAESRPVVGFTSAAEDWLLKQSWPGNVRQLENTVERAVLLAAGRRIDVTDLSGNGGASGSVSPPGPTGASEPESLESLAEHEQRYISEVMRRVQGNRSRAARILGLDRSSLWRKLKQVAPGEPDEPDEPGGTEES
jgi:two-component system response regulator HydG